MKTWLYCCRTWDFVRQVGQKRYRMVPPFCPSKTTAWWAGKKLTAENAKNAEFKSEEEVRQFCALPACSWKYLRFIKSESGSASSAISAVKSMTNSPKWTRHPAISFVIR